jgi:hypothetical protein
VRGDPRREFAAGKWKCVYLEKLALVFLFVFGSIFELLFQKHEKLNISLNVTNSHVHRHGQTD